MPVASFSSCVIGSEPKTVKPRAVASPTERGFICPLIAPDQVLQQSMRVLEGGSPMSCLISEKE